MEHKLAVGIQLFLIGKEEQGGAVTLGETSLLTVTAVEADHFKVTTEGRQYRWSGNVTEIELRFELPMAEPDRFVFLVDQEIDGLHFAPIVPIEPGAYWFYGMKGNHDDRLRLGLGTVAKASNGTGYFFFHDFAFAGKNMGMTGLWAKAVIPRMPGHDGSI